MRRTLIWGGIVLAVLTVCATAGATTVYFYDSARADVLAKGVVVAGVDVGGLTVSEARARIRRAVVARLERPVAVRYGSRRFVVRPVRQGLAVDLDGMLARATAETRSGSLLDRFLRDVRGRSLAVSVPLAARASSPSLRRLVDRVARTIDRPARAAAVVPSSTSLEVQPSHPGRAVRRDALARLLERTIVDPAAPRTLKVPVRPVRAAVTTADLPKHYPAYITVSRETYRLRLFRGLKLYRTYTIAVGQQGLETPAGLYTIDDKQVDPWWHVPNSAWAGDLAGKVIPPGPDDPIKARWLGFYNGAGIHGTDAVYSLGSAASHGCIRMSIPDVIELYDLVPTGTPIYVG